MACRHSRLLGWLAVLSWLLAPPLAVRADGPPEWLPHYDLDIVLDTGRLLVRVREDVTWVNRGTTPVRDIVFNAHAAYRIPESDVGLLAKMLEILRVAPSEGMPGDGPVLQMEDTRGLTCNGKSCREHIGPDGKAADGKAADGKAADGKAADGKNVPFSFDAEIQTALIIPLPEPLEPGQSVAVRLNFVLKLPPKKGRWGQWDGITTLAQWLPVVAVHDGKTWQPAPFIPW